MIKFRKAVYADVDGVEAIYNKVLTLEEQGRASIGWQRGVYPTGETARMAMRRDDLFVCEENDRLLATAIINHMQMDSYSDGEWKVAADGDEVMVLHTLVVDPDASGRGIGSKFVDFYEQYAKSQGCKDLRMDTQAKNHAARRLYNGLGYEEIGTTQCEFNGISGITLVLLEKPVSKVKARSMVDIKEYPATDRSETLEAQLTTLWNGSVRTTHHFLTESDIQDIRPYVVEALKGVPILGVGIINNGDDANGQDEFAGFVGIADGKIEMLFVAKDYIGKGVGRQLMEWAVGAKHATMIDVNEQNEHAAAVYRHWGFKVYERTETDDQGNPFPILRMKLADANC